MDNTIPPAKTFLCHRCNRGFARLEHLQRHERSHTKEKPFRCTSCPKGFTRKDLLMRHRRLTHLTPSEPSPVQEYPSSTREPESPNSPLANGSRLSIQTVLPPSEQPQLIPSAQTFRSSGDGEQQSADHIQPSSISTRFFSTSDFDQLDQGLNGNFPGLSLDHSSGADLFEPRTPAFGYDFSAFMDSVPNLAHPFSPTYQPLPVFYPNLEWPSPVTLEENAVPKYPELLREQGRAAITIPAVATSALEASIPNSLLSRYGSRLPSLAPEDRPPRNGPHPQGSVMMNSQQLLVSVECRQRIIDELAKFPVTVDEDFVLPSRHTLSRFIGGYFQNFHDHYPFFHVATLELTTMSVDLLLAIAALGARYTRETEMGLELFHVGRGVVLDRLRRRRTTSIRSSLSRNNTRSNTNTIQNLDPEPVDDDNASVVEMMQTLLLLIAIATWYKREPATADALSIRSMLHALAQEQEISQNQLQPPEDWKAWIRFETIKRTQFVIFCFFNIHTILFDLPPMMLASELHLHLPCSEKEWKASCEHEWREACSISSSFRQDFGDVFADLFVSGEISDSPQRNVQGFSALGGCALVHAVLQQIYLVRAAQLPNQQQKRSSLSEEEINLFELALKRWATYWERNQESSMDPLSPHGPLTFTSTALLRLAYIRLNLDLGPVRSLSSWDAHVVANSLHRSPGVQRSNKMARAALHCAHALSIPVKLGINYVAQTQLIHWSNQHALCSLECAVLLAKWLEAVTVPDPTPSLTAAEHRVLGFVVQLVAETLYRVSCSQILEQKAQLSGITVRLWAKLYQFSSVWQMVDLIGQSLNIYADVLESQYR